MNAANPMKPEEFAAELLAKRDHWKSAYERLVGSGPAFPHPVAIGPGGDVYSPHDVNAPGMSLRDWFAGQALAGMAVSIDDPDACAVKAFEVADAMLKAREA